MFPKPKFCPPVGESEGVSQNRVSSGSTGASAPQGSYGGRRNQTDWTQNQSYFWRTRFNPSCAPEQAEAFVEESGIKVFETSPQTDDDDDDDEEGGGARDGGDDEEEDPLYQLDVLDDTIVEDDEEDDDESDDDEEVEEEEEIVNEVNKPIIKIDTCESDQSQLSSDTNQLVPSIEVDQSQPSITEGTSNENIQIPELIFRVASSELSSTGLLSESASNDRLEAPPPPSSLPPPQVAWTSSSTSLKDSLEESGSTNSTNSSAECMDDSNHINNGYASDSGLRRLSIPSSSSPSSPSKAFPPSETKSPPDQLITEVPSIIPQNSSVMSPTHPVLASPQIVTTNGTITPAATMNGNGPTVPPAVVPSVPYYGQPNVPPFLQKTVSAPNSRPTSRSGSPLAIGLTGNMWAGIPVNKENSPAVATPKQTQPGYFSQALSLASGKGKSNRLNLPLARVNAPRHKFIIRRVNEQETSAKRTTAYIDSRLGDLRCQDASRHAKANTSPVWLRRQFGQAVPDVNIGSGKASQNADSKPYSDGSGAPSSGHQQKLDQDRSKAPDESHPDGNSISGGSSQQQPQGFRPRAGTWSIANSRRLKIKQEKEEEAAKLRQRRKSGDDITAAENAPSQPFSAAAGRKDDAPIGFFDSFRPRSKSDAKAILQARQRRKSGDDLLNAATTKEKEKKKEPSPGFLESFRPRSKSDAARGKKPNIMTTVKNAVQNWNEEKDRKRRDREAQRKERQLMLGRFSKSCQQTLVSPGANNRGGRRSGEATPVEPAPNEDVYHTWHAGSGPKSTIGKVWELFRHNKAETSEERQRRKSGGKHDKGQLHRRHSMDPDRRRHGSGGFGATYIRGDDPNQAAIIFRDCRGLPAAAPFLENFKRSELEENESQILVKFFKYHHTYDLIPTSAKLVIFDTRLQVKKAFYALVYNGVRAAPLWDSTRQEFVGMLTITDFIRILQSFYNSPNRKMEELEDHRLEMWRTLLKDDGRKLISIAPNECLYDAIRSLIHQKIHRLPVIDPITGNVLYIITHKRILKFLYLYINELPKPSVLQKSLRELDIGTYDNIETARGETQIIEALNKFVERRISALPIVDDEGKLIDIYAKFDVINLAAEGTYHNLDVTLHQANEYRNEWFEGVLKCDLDETLGVVMERIVRAEVHRLVVVDKNNKVIGIISLSDILNELVLKPCNDDPVSMRNRTIAHMEAALSGDIPSPEKSGAESQSSDLGEIQNCTSTADDDWGGTSDMSAISVSEEKLQERKSSAESEDNFDLEVNKIPDSIAQQGVISISS